MKIKKFNAVLAAVVLTGGLLIWNAGSLLTSTITGVISDTTPKAERVATATHASADAEARSADPFSEVSKKVQIISWQNYKGQVPADVTLKKWTLDGRTYYQASGPLHFLSQANGQSTEFLACSAFVPRERADYDEWIIKRDAAEVHHYRKDHPKDDTREGIGVSPLPEERYRAETDGNRITVTFWCRKGATPGNIVFRYENLGGEFSFATTSRHIPGIRWDNHRADRWTYP